MYMRMNFELFFIVMMKYNKIEILNVSLTYL